MSSVTTLCKLTRQDMTTHGGFRYELGVKAEAKGTGTALCSDGYLHAYEHPLLAVLHNPIHGAYDNPRLFEAETDCQLVREGYMKCGVRSMTLIRELPLPVITTEQRVRYAILCAMEVCTDPRWRRWAEDWLSGKDRSAGAAGAAGAARAAEAAEEASNGLDLIALAKKAVEQ